MRGMRQSRSRLDCSAGKPRADARLLPLVGPGGILEAPECAGGDMSLQQLEAAVAGLPPDDLEAFARWFDEYRADAWDRQIEADVAAGRLDAAGRRADEDFEAGRCTPR
jgi:hypothetical protein